MIVVKAQMVAASAKAAQHLKVYYFDADYEGGLRNQVGRPRETEVGEAEGKEGGRDGGKEGRCGLLCFV